MKKRLEIIKELIIESKIERALWELGELDKERTLDLEKTIVLLRFQLSSLSKNFIEGLITIGEKNTGYQTLGCKILDLLTEIGRNQHRKSQSLIPKIPEDELVRQKLKQYITIWYNNIYEWHKKKALNTYIYNFGQDIALSRWGREYFSFRDDIKDINNASLEEIVASAKEIINGRMGWSSKEQMGLNKNLFSDAYHILYHTENSTFLDNPFYKSFDEESEYVMTRKNETLFKVKYQIYPYQNLGGLTSSLTLNKYWDKTHIYTPFLLGLEESNDESDIIVLIKNGKISIESILLIYPAIQDSYPVRLKLTIRNESDSVINLMIRKGQLFEDSQRTLDFQVLALCNDYSNLISVGQLMEVDLELISLTPNFKQITSNTGLISCFYFNNPIVNKASIEKYYNEWITKNKNKYKVWLIRTSIFVISISSLLLIMILLLLMWPYIRSFILNYVL